MSALVKQNQKYGILVAILTAMIFGLHPAASRAAYADGANVTFVLMVATFVRAFMMTIACLVMGKTLLDTKKHRKLGLICGFLQAISVTSIMGAVSYMSGPLVIIMLYLAPLMLLLFMVIKGERRLTLVAVMTIFTVLAGASFVLDLWNTQTDISLIGIGLASVSVFVIPANLYIIGHQMTSRNPMIVGAETMVVAFILLVPLFLWQTPVLPQSIVGYGWAMLTAVSLGLGAFGVFFGISLLGSFGWSVFDKTEVIFTTLFSIWFLGEGLSLIQYLGMAIVIGSLVTYQLLSHKEKSA